MLFAASKIRNLVRLPSSGVLNDSHESWAVLAWYNLYRFTLGVILVIGEPAFMNIWGRSSYYMTQWVVVYLVSCLVYALLIYRRILSPYLLAHLVLLSDLVIIYLLSYGSGQVNQGLLTLLLTIVAASAIFFRTTYALLYAVFAGSIVCYMNLVVTNDVSRGLTLPELTFSVVSFLVTALSIGFLARRTARSRAVVSAQADEIADLDEINNHIIDHLKLGVLLTDDSFKITTCNENAARMLGKLNEGGRLPDALQQALGKDLALLGPHKLNRIDVRLHDGEYRIEHRKLNQGLLVTIEDYSRINMELQAQKLQSVGQMAASIAHEIRNPLSAVNQAAQLIHVDELDEESVELLAMVRKNVQRIDQIIESVLGMSRQHTAMRENIELHAWLRRFLEQFEKNHMHNEIKMAYEIEGSPLNIAFDPIQLEQIMTNFCNNSIKYGNVDGKTQLHLKLKPEQGRPTLTFSDEGPGIGVDKVQRLFEPFFTTDAKGTGLGLYLVREFCLLNQAQVSYLSGRQSAPYNGAFKIIFAPEVDS